MKEKRYLFRGLANIFLALLVIFTLIYQVANVWSGKVNELLGTSDSSVIRSSNADDYEYKSDFASAKDLLQAEKDYNTRAEIEGAVSMKGTPAIDGGNVTLFGMRSGEYMQFGGSMGELTDGDSVVTLSEAMEENGFKVNPQMISFYDEMAKVVDEDEKNMYLPQKTSGGNVVNSYYDNKNNSADYEGEGTKINEVPVSEYKDSNLEGYKDAAVIVIGRDGGESACFYPGKNGINNPDEFTNSPTGNILGLSNNERDMINYVKNQGFKKVVVLLNTPSAVEVEELKADAGIDSIMWIGNPGAYGTYGIAKLLSGEYLPSGHLSDTYAVNTALSPAAQNYGIYTFSNASAIDTSSSKALRNSWYLVEEEGIYAGYSYYETRYFDAMLGQGNATQSAGNDTVNNSSQWDYDKEVSYSFGYGLEGSEFTEEIVDSQIDWSGEKESTVTVKVTNVGENAAKHAVQLYVSAPYTDYDRANGIEKSAIQLVGYAKTGEAGEKSYADYVALKPGKSEEVTVTFNATDLYSYDNTYKHDGVVGAYLLEQGQYCFATGNGAHDAVNAVLKNNYPDKGVESTGAALTVDVEENKYITKSNDTTIENQLDSADLNTWNTDAKATYLTRNDWAGTFPKGVTQLTANDEMIKYLKNKTYDAAEAVAEYDGPESFTYGADNGLTIYDMKGLDYDDPKYEELLDQMTLEELYNQYIAYIEPLDSIQLPKLMCADSPLGLIAAIGQYTKGSIFEVDESDEANAKRTNVYVSPVVVASTFSPLMQSEEGRMIGNDALWSGYNCWYGPALNLHRTPYNGRNLAYYSEDPLLTGRTCANVIAKLNEYGVTTEAKHFAFNDQEADRDGLAVFLNEQTARERELRGYQIAIRDGDMKGIMTAFNRIGCTHVAADRNLMNGILRGEWGYKGYVITDSIKSAEYFLPVECLMAGNDMMLGGSNSASTWGFTVEDCEDDIVIQHNLREAMHRKVYMCANSNVLNGVTSSAVLSGSNTWWINLLLTGIIISIIGSVLFVVLYFLEERKCRRLD